MAALAQYQLKIRKHKMKKKKKKKQKKKTQKKKKKKKCTTKIRALTELKHSFYVTIGTRYTFSTSY